MMLYFMRYSSIYGLGL